MKITWIVRSFLDYRVPVYKALDDLCGHELTVIYYKDVVPERTQAKLKAVLGERAIARENEIRIGNGAKRANATEKKGSFRIPLSPGMIRQVIRTKPEVMISDGFMQWTYAPLFVNALKGIPHVMCHERTNHMERNASIVRLKYRKFVSRWIDVIDCNGKLCAEHVKGLLGWGDDRLTFGHMVADVKGMANNVSQIDDSCVLKLRNENKIRGVAILFVGRLLELKGVRQLLDAWKVFKNNSNETCTLIYVGGGPLETELKERVSNEGIPDVVITGAIDYDNIAQYYAMSDCFILPTTGDNWSLVVPEAMACGLPVATTIYNGCYPELVQPENGWVFDSLNQQSIIETFQKIVSSKDRLKEMGEASKKIVANHTAENAAKGIMEAIEKAMKRHK